jgi:hypothetical protein
VGSTTKPPYRSYLLSLISTAAPSHGRPASTAISCDSCHSQISNQPYSLYSYLLTLLTVKILLTLTEELIYSFTQHRGLRQHHALAALSAVKELLYPFRRRVGVDPRVHVDDTDEGYLHLPEVELQFHGRAGSNVLTATSANITSPNRHAELSIP